MNDGFYICNLVPTEFLALVLFIALNAGIYGSALICLARTWRKEKSLIPADRPARILLALATVSLLCLAYSFFIEPFQLETTKLSIASAKLNGIGRKIRLVHISDIHSDPFPRVEDRLPVEIAKLEPDLIVFTGDAANCRKGLSIFRDCMRRITRIAPTFVVNGNHDSRQSMTDDVFAGTGAQVVNCRIASIACNGKDITIAGVPVDGEACLPSILADLPKKTFNIFLYHYPAAAPRIADSDIDLFCAGHTHGGQVRLPWYGAIITRSATGKRFEAGYYKLGRMHMYVSRGIGMVGKLVPRLRFLCKPEVTLIELGGTRN